MAACPVNLTPRSNLARRPIALTQRRLEANRRNAAHSTGPRTPDRKGEGSAQPDQAWILHRAGPMDSSNSGTSRRPSMDLARLQTAGRAGRKLRRDHRGIVRANGGDAALRKYRGAQIPSAMRSRIGSSASQRPTRSGGAPSSPAGAVTPGRIMEADHPRASRGAGHHTIRGLPQPGHPPCGISELQGLKNIRIEREISPDQKCKNKPTIRHRQIVALRLCEGPSRSDSDVSASPNSGPEALRRAFAQRFDVRHRRIMALRLAKARSYTDLHVKNAKTNPLTSMFTGNRHERRRARALAARR